MTYTSATLTNSSSKFEHFSLSLPNGAVLSGISHIPLRNSATPNGPLLVGLHGGLGTSQYFDISPDYTAFTYSSMYYIPFVAIDRPGYESSTPPNIDSDTTFWQASGRLLNEYILPAVWNKFGIPSGCDGIVAMGHSMGVPVSIVAAALYCDDKRNGSKPAYPFAGCIISGWGTRRSGLTLPGVSPEIGKDRATFPSSLRDMMFFSEPTLNLAHPAVRALSQEQSVTVSLEEMAEMQVWASYLNGYIERIDMPALLALGEHDWLWQGTQEHLEEYKDLFKRSDRVETLVVKGGAHCMELSYKADEWYKKSFEWANGVCEG